MAARRPVFGDGDAPSGRLPGRLDRCQRAEEPASLSLALLHRDRDCWGCVAHEYLLRCALRYVTSDEEETLYRRFAPRRFVTGFGFKLSLQTRATTSRCGTGAGGRRAAGTPRSR